MQPHDANKGLLNLRSGRPFQSLRRLSQASHRRFASSLINQYFHYTPARPRQLVLQNLPLIGIRYTLQRTYT
jgi:hypothetical protein